VKCGHRFEKIEGFDASATKKCPKCGAKAERQLSAPAIQFKGSGWYVTDYAGKKPDSSSEKSGDSGDSGKSEKSSETKSTDTAKSTESSKSEKGTKKKK
jgi:putative FmdB family regulatory protein